MNYTTLFFDLDDTLYPPENGLWPAIGRLMDQYMLERMSLSVEEVPILRRKYYEEYGTTLRGLQLHHQIDSEDFLEYVHDLPVEAIVQPDPILHRLLKEIPQPKYIFTNANEEHAQRVLVALGVERCFTDVIDVRDMDFNCKPNVAAYQTALEIAGENDPRRCIYIDDSPRNLAPAFEMGFFTILIGSNEAHTVAHRWLPRLHDLPAVLPELWGKGNSNGS